MTVSQLRCPHCREINRVEVTALNVPITCMHCQMVLPLRAMLPVVEALPVLPAHAFSGCPAGAPLRGSR